MASFKEIVGMPHVKGYLQKAIELNRISHAYIFSGEAGSGKRLLADAFAAAILCEAGQIDACMECASCKKVTSGNHPDLIHVTHEKPNTISVDEIRVQVNRIVAVKPYSGRYKVYIISEAHKMSIQAQNALLKTIEEPPEYAVIILLTSNEQELLPTIASRCVNLRLRPVRQELVQKYLMDNFQIPDYKAKVCASFAQGNIGKAVRIATSEEFNNLKDEVLSFVKHVHDMPVHEIIDYMKNLYQYKLEINDYLDFMAVWYRDVLLFKATKDMNGAIFSDEAHEIMRQANRISYDGLETIIQALDNAKRRLEANVGFDLTMELLFMTIKEN